MKKENIRKYLRRADDCMEKVERKMRCIDATLFFLLMGMESFYRQEDCYEVAMLEAVRDHMKMLEEGDIAELHNILNKLREV